MLLIYYIVTLYIVVYNGSYNGVHSDVFTYCNLTMMLPLIKQPLFSMVTDSLKSKEYSLFREPTKKQNLDVHCKPLLLMFTSPVHLGLNFKIFQNYHVL